MVKTFFDFEFVKKIKPEFKQFNDEMIIEKYLENPNFIFSEKLNNFDYNFYILNYRDLRHLNYLQACCHYLMHGIKENRVCCKYNLEYIQQKIILKNINNNNLNNLSIIYEFFYYDYYILKYRDLINFNYIQALNHLLMYGFNEKRIYNPLLEKIQCDINNISNNEYLDFSINYIKNCLNNSNNSNNIDELIKNFVNKVIKNVINNYKL